MPGLSPCSVVPAERTEEEVGRGAHAPGRSPLPDEHTWAEMKVLGSGPLGSRT